MQPLGRYYQKHKVVPTPNLFWDQYPYRIIINAKGYGPNRIKKREGCGKLLVEELKSCFPGATNIEVMRVTIRGQHVMIYCASHDVFEHLAGVWADRVIEITGPITNHHIELLEDPHCDCYVLDRLWYNQYNFRVLVHGGDIALYKDAKAFLISGLENFKCYGNEIEHGFTFYADHAEFMKVWGLFTLAFPAVKMEMVRGFVNDTQQLN